MEWPIDPFWIWLGVGLLFLILELATGSLFLIWTGLAALAVSVLVFFAEDLGLHWQLIVFSVTAVTTTYLGRNYFRGRIGPAVSDKPFLNRRSEQLAGRTVFALVDFKSGEGRVRLGDSQWSARIESAGAPPVVAKDDALKIVRIEGATLIVVPA